MHHLWGGGGQRRTLSLFGRADWILEGKNKPENPSEYLLLIQEKENLFSVELSVNNATL